MKTPFLLALFTLITQTALAKCDSQAISYVHSTSYGLKTGSSNYGESITVNVPLLIKGEAACYHQKNKLAMKMERVKEKEFVEYSLIPLEADFENVPNASLTQYLNIEYDEHKKASEVQIVSFICSGETPIGGDAFSDSLFKLMVMAPSSIQASTHTVFAMGQAADNLEGYARSIRSVAFDKFQRLYEERSPESATEIRESNVLIPNILAGVSVSSVSTVERKLYSSFYTKVGSSINGCSNNFKTVMKDYLLENVVKEKPFPSITIKKKGKKYSMKWIL